MGLLYGGNTAGAVFGCLLAGFYLLRVHDMATATFVAAGINAAVALASLALASAPGPVRGVRGSAGARRRARPPDVRRAGRWPVYVAIALSGAAALGAEVVWTRLLGLMLGATVYTFSHHPGGFPGGPGHRQRRARRCCCAASIAVRRARWLWAGARLLLAGAMAWTAFMLASSLPYWPINPLLSTSPWFTFQIDLVRAIWAILPRHAAVGRELPAGPRRRGPSGRRIPAAWWAASMPPIPSAPFRALWPSA